MNEMQTILSDTVTRLFTDRVTQELRESAEKGQWPDALWKAVEEGGLTLPQIPEARGGGGGSWQDAYIVVAAAGRFAVPLPIPETMVAAWLLSDCGLDVPTGPLTVAPVRAGERLSLAADGSGRHLSGVATRVPWGRAARHVVVLADDQVALVGAGSARVEPDLNLALEPRDTLAWDRATVLAAAPATALPAGAIPLAGALVRSAQMAGGLEYLLAQTVRHVSERKQFGRAIGSFQAINTTSLCWPGTRLQRESRLRAPSARPTAGTRRSRSPRPRSAPARRPGSARVSRISATARSASRTSTRCTS